MVPQGQESVEPPAMQQERLHHTQQEESVESSHTPTEANISPFGVTPWGKTDLSKEFIKIMRRKTTKCHRPILDVLVVGLESALCNSAMENVLGLPRIQDIQDKLPSISSLLIDIFHDYLGDTTTSTLRDFDLNRALYDNDWDGNGTEGKISVQQGSVSADFFFHVENRHGPDYVPDKPTRSIGPRYKVNPEAPSEIPGLDKKLDQFNRKREEDQWLSAVYLGALLFCILLEKNHSDFFKHCYDDLCAFIGDSELLYNPDDDLFAIQTFPHFRHALCRLMKNYVDRVRGYLCWRFWEAKKELREAFYGCGHINPLQYISEDRFYVGAHPITSDLNYDQRKTENFDITLSWEQRNLSAKTLFGILHNIVEQDGLYYSPTLPTINNLNNGYRVGKSHYPTSFLIL